MFYLVLAAAATSAILPAAPQPVQAEDDSSPATDCGGTTPSTNFLVPLPGELVLEVMFILLTLVLLVPHAQQSLYFYVNGFCLLLFSKTKNFVKYTFIYNTTLFFYTFASYLPLYFCGFAFPLN